MCATRPLAPKTPRPLATAPRPFASCVARAGVPDTQFADSMGVGNCFAEIEVAVEEVIMLLQQLLLS